ncbi:PREDICTED: uncharacterized protein LOC109485883 isoform X2 [Branchiostoma belcheri]|uniref:Uncharacterized protein LOC109485883 isoform X2 n=1 Tax=Branchiostoma belcheri TaxID=7741 RepID=A0A6P4ZV97_BRABE|nr:PREDICTED: uncharacterized protein LOC109485883 isoform X2 [Branchiostoma belcheri]
MELFREATVVVVVSLLCFSQGQVRSRLSFPRMRGRLLLPEPGLQLCRPSPCALQCEYGRETGARGCPLCRCRTAPDDINNGEIPTTDNPANLEQTVPVPLTTVPSDFGEFCRQEHNSNLSSCLLQSERPDDFAHFVTRLSVHPQSGLQSLNPCARIVKFIHLRTAQNRNNEEVELWVASDGNGRTRLQPMHEVTCRSATPVHNGCGTASAGGFCTEEKTLQSAYVISRDTLKPYRDWIYVKTSCSCHVEGLG